MGLEGRPDLIVRVDEGKSELGDYSYSIIEIKSARNILQAHILQAAVYNRLLGVVQGHEPQTFYIINRDGQIVTVQMTDVANDLDRVLDEMGQIIAGKPVEPCHGAGLWPWESHVNQLAIERNDVSPHISHINPAGRAVLSNRTT